MSDLKTSYMGIELKNPLIAGASSLSLNIESLKAIEAAGAGAVVFKSLFEEQIQLEALELENELEEYNERHAEMVKLFPTLKHAGPADHLAKLRKAKDTLSIPVIASLNAMYPEIIVELGTSVGISTMYMAAANPNSKVYTIEGEESILAIARNRFKQMGFTNIEPIAGNFDVQLPELIKRISTIDFAFIDGVIQFLIDWIEDHS